MCGILYRYDLPYVYVTQIVCVEHCISMIYRINEAPPKPPYKFIRRWSDLQLDVPCMTWELRESIYHWTYHVWHGNHTKVFTTGRTVYDMEIPRKYLPLDVPCMTWKLRESVYHWTYRVWHGNCAKIFTTGRTVYDMEITQKFGNLVEEAYNMSNSQ